MRIPKIKLLVGVLLVLIASIIPSVFLAELLSDNADTVIGGIDLSTFFVQLFVILIGAIGTGMIKDTFMRSNTKKRKW